MAHDLHLFPKTVSGSPLGALARADCFIFKKLMKMEKFICNTCGYVYDPAVGDPDAGIAPGTPFESLPDDWVCPLCGVGKDDFEPYNE